MPGSRYVDRIRAGEIAPWTTDHVTETEGARRTAEIVRDELGTLSADDPRRSELA